MRAGAGYVRACVPESVAGRARPAVRGGDDDARSRRRRRPGDRGGGRAVIAAAERADAVAIGPGLGRSDGTRELVGACSPARAAGRRSTATALWALDGHLDWVFQRDAPTVLTPHSGELARLLGRDSDWVDAHRLDAAGGAADDVGAVVLPQGRGHAVAAPGRGVLVCDLGNAGLASRRHRRRAHRRRRRVPRQGDGGAARAAAAAATTGLAARRASERHGTAGLLARDVVESLSPVLSSP